MRTISRLIVFPLLLSMLASCGAPPPPKQASGKKKRTKKISLEEETDQLLDAQVARLKISMDGDVDQVPEATGVLVRVFKRPMTSGVIEVFEAFAADEGSAAQHKAELSADGWRSWPPSPAPELANALADAHPALKDCPFLFAASDEPKDALEDPVRTVTCYKTVAEIAVALERERVLQYKYGMALPCQELRRISEKEWHRPTVLRLRAHCKAMGVDVEPGLAKDAPVTLRKRAKRNRTIKRRIRQ